MNWLHCIAATGITSYVIIAMDEELHSTLQRNGIASYYAKDEMLRTSELSVTSA